MNKNRLRTGITGIAVSLVLLGNTSLAVAKPALLPQKPAQQHFSSSGYISLAKNLTENAKRFTIAPKPTDEQKTELPVKAKPIVKPLTQPDKKTEIIHEVKQKVQPKAVPPVKVKKPELEKPASTQSHTLEISAGNTVQYKRLVPVTATAYTAAREENGVWGALDYFGNPLKVGTIAVDPDVIPLGSTVYITGYKFNGLPAGGMIAKATDTGSAVKGKRVDIFVPSSRADASEFGMQDVKVYIIR